MEQTIRQLELEENPELFKFYLQQLLDNNVKISIKYITDSINNIISINENNEIIYKQSDIRGNIFFLM